MTGRPDLRARPYVGSAADLDALRFSQRRGFHLVEPRPGAVEERCSLTPRLRPIGEHGIPIRDELELECSAEH